MVPGQETDKDEMYVAIVQFNELPVNFSICVNECQDKHLQCTVLVT